MQTAVKSAVTSYCEHMIEVMPQFLKIIHLSKYFYS